MTDKGRQKWDKENSTYMRVLVMANGNELVGYSKCISMEERRDKVDLLTNWIIRDFETGYLDRNTKDPRITVLNRADWYRQVSKNPLQRDLMFTMYYDVMEWHDTKYAENKKLAQFFLRYYSLVRKNASATTIRNSLYVNSRAPRVDPLSTERPRFPALEDLNFYIVRLQNEGRYTSEQINHFYRSYKEKFFSHHF
jgi:hypothetical protein